MSERRLRLLVFIVAYDAETTIQRTLRRIPASLLDTCEVEVLVIDDRSSDETFGHAEAVRRARDLPFRLTVLFNPVNQGYGGTRRSASTSRSSRGSMPWPSCTATDRYAPECLPDLIRPIASGEADAVFGSRMLERGQARRGGMPLYKLVGNRILTRLQNRLLRSSLSEFHSGYRLYSTAALRRIPFQLNSNAFHFDTEIIIQLLRAGQRIKELSIPTFYGDEICHVNGMKYREGRDSASLKARAQDLSLFYDRKFDCAPPSAVHSHDRLKLGFESTHELTLARIRRARASRIGPSRRACGPLRSRGCEVTRLVGLPDERTLPARLDGFDCVILLDVVEHLARAGAVRRRAARGRRQKTAAAGAREHRRSGVLRAAADAAAGAVQLQQAGHSRPHAHAVVHLRHVSAAIRAVRLRHAGVAGGPGAVSVCAAGSAERQVVTGAEPGPHPRQSLALGVSDLSAWSGRVRH